MKKLAAFALAIIMVLSLASCAISIEEDTAEPAETKSAPETTEKASDTTEKAPDTTLPPVTEVPVTEPVIPDVDDGFDPYDYYDLLVDEYDFNGITIPLPEGFKEQESSGMLTLVPSDYPAHTDSILLYVSSDKYEDVTEASVSAQLEAVGAEDIDFYKDVIEFDDGTSLRYTEIFYSMSAMGVDMYQINFSAYYEDKTVTVVYTLVSEDYFELLEASYYFMGFYDE